MKMGQSRLHSFMEVNANMLVGIAISTVINRYLLPVLGMAAVDWSKAFWVTMLFTVVSMFRSYIVRRTFNWLHVRAI